MTVSRSWFMRFLFHHPELKIMAFVLALVTWYAVRDATSFETVVRDVKIEVQLREGMAIQHQSASTVDVALRGSLEDVRRIDNRRVRILVDLRDLGVADRRQVHLTDDNVEGIRGLTVVELSPSRLLLAVDQEEEKRVPVRGRVIGKPQAGEVREVGCEPSIVLVRGPAQKLKTLAILDTQPVDVDGRISSFIRRVGVMPPEDNWPARIEPSEVQVKVQISGQGQQREWKQLPVGVLLDAGPIRRVDLNPARVDLTVQGTAESLSAFQTNPPRVYVDASGLTVGIEQELPVRIHGAEAMGLTVGTNPERVRVTVRD
jgi:YbbR domain-containing protein